MSGQHTQGRLKAIHGSWIVTEEDNTQIARGASFGPHVENARRLAACWNACEGVSTEQVEELASIGGVAGQFLYTEELRSNNRGFRAERDQMRADLAAARAEIRKVEANNDANWMKLRDARALLGEVVAADDSGSITMMGSDQEYGMPVAEVSYSFDDILERIRALLKGGA